MAREPHLAADDDRSFSWIQRLDVAGERQHDDARAEGITGRESVGVGSCILYWRSRSSIGPVASVA